MKVNIGPYRDWIGPYQIAEKILFWKDKYDDDSVHEFGKWLSNTFLNDICQWIDKKKKRKVKVHIDNYDTWEMDHTLALIICPLLKKMKATGNGSPKVEDVDVPEELRSTSAPAKVTEWDIDANWVKRWDWVLDEMIWAFEQCSLNDKGDSQFNHNSDQLEILFKPIENSTNSALDLNYQKNPDKPKYYVDYEGQKLHYERMNNGFRLFGKYYLSLWD